jgi:hypothetical protein
MQLSKGKLPTAEAFKLAERDKSMSEQKSNYMQELSTWIDDNVIYPLQFGDSPEDPNARSLEEIAGQVRLAIREKVLESYHNGLKAGQRPVRKEARQRTGVTTR